jgi:hypothetical protein
MPSTLLFDEVSIQQEYLAHANARRMRETDNVVSMPQRFIAAHTVSPGNFYAQAPAGPHPMPASIQVDTVRSDEDASTAGGGSAGSNLDYPPRRDRS